MKKIILTTFTGILAVAMQGQVVITQADFASPGDELFIGNDTIVPVSIVAGAAGTAQTWNFSTLVPDRMQTINFVDPSGLPAYGDFPASNISFKQLGADAYINKSAAGIELLGLAGQIMGAPFPVTAPVNPSQTLMQFPAQVGVTFQDTAIIDVSIDISAQAGTYGIDSARFKRIYYSQHNIDAEGALTIPLGTYNAIRDKVDETTIDSVWIYSPNGGGLLFLEQGWQIVPDLVAGFIGLDGGATTTITRNYRWFAANSKYFLVDLDVNPTNNTAIGARYQADPSTLPSAIDEAVYTNNGVSVFPNPATDVVNIMLKDLKGNATIALFDATGRQVSSAMLTTNQNTISVNGLTNGLYLYRVATANGNVLKTGKVLVAN